VKASRENENASNNISEKLSIYVIRPGGDAIWREISIGGPEISYRAIPHPALAAINPAASGILSSHSCPKRQLAWRSSLISENSNK
jgi:hypothetical protein